VVGEFEGEAEGESGERGVEGADGDKGDCHRGDELDG
jgi:hypothetical protein